jgi:hypothetical protein
LDRVQSFTVVSEAIFLEVPKQSTWWKRRSCRARPKLQLKKAKTFDPTVGLRSNFTVVSGGRFP